MSGHARAEGSAAQNCRPDVSIFKIVDPKKMEACVRQRVLLEAYVPQRVLLGPYYGRREKEKVVVVQSYKETAFREMTTRFNKKMNTTNDADFGRNAILAILKNESEIRNSYEHQIEGGGENLAEMLCFEGCFILKVLKDLAERGLTGSWINEVTDALNDILMLENQIPWIVLKELLRLERPEHDDVERTLLEVMVKVTCSLFIIPSADRTAALQLDWLEARKVHHFLDFVYKVIVLWSPNQANTRNQGDHKISIGMPADKNDEALNHDVESIPCAVELKNAGIKFQPFSGGISKINFDPASSTIYLPRLTITYDREVLLRNLIAFELLKSSEINYVRSYVNLMSDLIKSRNDVVFLRSMSILTNTSLSVEKVPSFFNGLLEGEGVTVKKPDICADLRKGVNTDYKNRCGYCKNSLRVQLQELWRDHFSSPCKALALAVTSAVLCLAIIQTIYTVKK